MSRGNDFPEIISAIFAIIVFILIGGVLIQSLGTMTSVIGNFGGLLSLFMIIVFILIIIKLVKSIFDMFSNVL